jgi:hypothetical protein
MSSPLHPEKDLDYLVGEVAGSIWTVLSTDPDLQNQCLLILPALSFKVKQSLTTLGKPQTFDQLNLLSKNIATSVAEALTFFNLKITNPAETVKSIEMAVRGSLQGALT